MRIECVGELSLCYVVYFDNDEKVPYQFECYEDAFEFCSAFNGGKITNFVSAVCGKIDEWNYNNLKNEGEPDENNTSI